MQPTAPPGHLWLNLGVKSHFRLTRRTAKKNTGGQSKLALPVLMVQHNALQKLAVAAHGCTAQGRLCLIEMPHTVVPNAVTIWKKAFGERHCQ
jgi:hypothetical protein